MDTRIDTQEYKGYTINIHADHNPEDPREWDNLGTMVCFHSRYDLGDKHDHTKPIYFLQYLLSELPEKKLEQILRKIPNLSKQDFVDIHEDPYGYLDMAFTNDSEDIDFCLEALEKTHIILPLYLYDHSGITMNTTGFSCRWDSGQVGWIYVSKAKVKEEYGNLQRKTIEKVRGYLKGEVETYDQYLTGQVYGYVIEDPEGNETDSCWGFYGDPNGYLMQEARGSIDYEIKHRREQAVKDAMGALQDIAGDIFREQKMILAGII